MRQKLGRLIQLVALIVLPLAMAGNLVPNDPLPPGTMLGFTVAGVALFYFGWVLSSPGKE